MGNKPSGGKSRPPPLDRTTFASAPRRSLSSIVTLCAFFFYSCPQHLFLLSSSSKKLKNEICLSTGGENTGGDGSAPATPQKLIVKTSDVRLMTPLSHGGMSPSYIGVSP